MESRRDSGEKRARVAFAIAVAAGGPVWRQPKVGLFICGNLDGEKTAPLQKRQGCGTRHSYRKKPHFCGERKNGAPAATATADATRVCDTRPERVRN